MKLYVKNMVCPRCIMAVEQILAGINIPADSVHLGEVDLKKELSDNELDVFSNELQKVGFELLDDAKSQLIDKVKTLLIEKVQNENIEDHFSLNKFLSTRIFKDYSSVSKLFSQTEGITIEQFFLLQKIEKIKEKLVYNEHSLGEIAVSLGYSSTQHLSGQFKRLTGMTPTEFKNLASHQRRAIDNIG